MAYNYVVDTEWDAFSLSAEKEYAGHVYLDLSARSNTPDNYITIVDNEWPLLRAAIDKAFDALTDPGTREWKHVKPEHGVARGPQLRADLRITLTDEDFDIIYFCADPELVERFSKYGNLVPSLTVGYNLYVDPRYDFQEVLAYMASFQDAKLPDESGLW